MEKYLLELQAVLDKYRSLGISQQIDYDKFYLYSIITHSTAIEGSTVTEIENQLLFDEGISAKGKPLVEQLMNLDLKHAYEQFIRWAEIEQYEKSMDDDVVINVGKDLENVGKDKMLELSERQQNIISVVKLYPEITIPELAQRMSGKKTVTTRTIERDIAALQAKGILKREGGRKSGKWIVVNI